MMIPPDTETAAPSTSTRLGSLDAYRGFVMFLMMAEVLHLQGVSRAVPDSAVWRTLALHQTHVEWVGCNLHDLIQPSFSFMVGVALVFSMASRVAKGQSKVRMTLHAFWRALLLILLGVWLRSTGSRITNWTFEDTLSQIGMGYGFLFLLGFKSMRWQWAAFGILLLGYWAVFAFYPLPPPDFDYGKVGVSAGWLQEHGLSGFAARWQKNSNPAWAFDTWWLNLFPREQPFTHNGGGYATLSFIPTLATMILGLLAGGLLRSERKPGAKVLWLLGGGVVGLGAGWALNATGICPSVKRIWTPAWVLFSGGWCCLILAAFYAVIDWGRLKAWAFPLKVIGMNSIAAYCMAHLFEDFIKRSLQTHLGHEIFRSAGPAYEAFFVGVATLLVFWLILWWMYRRKLFLRI
jgi:heparan-alpha-glucosaminide N-acetyltransferase